MLLPADAMEERPLGKWCHCTDTQSVKPLFPPRFSFLSWVHAPLLLSGSPQQIIALYHPPVTPTLCRTSFTTAISLLWALPPAWQLPSLLCTYPKHLHPLHLASTLFHLSCDVDDWPQVFKLTYLHYVFSSLHLSHCHLHTLILSCLWLWFLFSPVHTATCSLLS